MWERKVCTGAGIAAPISFVDSVPTQEKAYHIMYGDDEKLPRTNIKREWIETTMQNVRGSETALSYHTNGIAICELESAMSYKDFDQEQRVRDVYFSELENHLKHLLNANLVKFFRYGIRKRHAAFPISTGEEYEFAQPTSIAHIDATLASTEEEMERQFGDEANSLMRRRFQWVNVWKPLRGPVNDWPLCFCDPLSVDSTDIEVTDMVYAEYFTENQSLRHNQNQKWYYLSDHRPEEIIIFKQSDSDSTAAGGVPHCSFKNPEAGPNESPRESIEARALVVY